MKVREDFEAHNFASDYTTRFLEIVSKFISVYIKLTDKNFHLHSLIILILIIAYFPYLKTANNA